MPSAYTLTAASGVLTASGVFTNTQTVVVGGKTYTTQTTLTDTDGNVAIGASAAATLQNLYDAINLTGTAGTQYAASMTINAEVAATGVDATTLTVTAKTPGSVGNLIASTETQTNAAWGAAVLEGGAGHVAGWADSVLTNSQLNADAMRLLKTLTPGAD